MNAVKNNNRRNSTGSNYYYGYINLLRTARNRLRRLRDREERKRIEIEIAYISKEIEDYGFSFFQEHYLPDPMNRLQEIVDNLS